MKITMFLFLLLSFLSYGSCVINSATGDFKKISDNASIVISLQNYNATAPGGESIDSLYSIPGYSRTEIILTQIPDDVHFVVLQVHSYLVDVILSLYEVPLQSTSIQGTNVGLVKMYSKVDLSFYLNCNSSSEEVDVMVSVQAYPANAPIPGGCNMEFPVEVSPFLLTTFNDLTTDVNFAPSAPPSSVLSQNVASNECNLKPSPVHHHVYHRYFPERDFSKETYFDVLKSFMTTGRILESGRLVPEKLTGFPTRKIFATYPGTGNAFVVISHFNNHTSVYVPSFTYGCYDFKDNNMCLVLTTTFSRVLCAAILFMGLFNCLFGHFFFRMEIFLLGFLANGIVLFIFISILFSPSVALVGAVVTAVIISTLKCIACSICSLPITSVVLTTSVFGFLLASVIYYPITDYVDLLVLDTNFWGIFIGIVVSCPVLMLFLAENANIISCAFVGSYVSILSIDHYIGSNLRFIVINTIRRAIGNKFNLAIIGPPFQWKDIALCCLWVTVTLLGVLVQKKLCKNKPPYPPPVNLLQRWMRPSSQHSERTPLLTGFPRVVNSQNFTGYH